MENDNTLDTSKFTNIAKQKPQSFNDLLEAFAGLSFEKQFVFADVIGDNGWQLNMNTASIVFGDVSFPIQVIGSFSFNNNSWMWGWANTQSGIPENLLLQSNKLKEFGEEHGINELVEPHFNSDEGFEHKIGMVACGLFNSKSYYCANYGQGTLVVTIDDEKIPAIDKSQLEKVLTSFPQLISSVVLNHKQAFKNYLIDRDFKLYISDSEIEGLKDGKIVTAKFDDLDRLESLKGKL
ncbi:MULTISPECIES: DUF6882 domain-containing protein [Cellulophaga]|uniref:Uncharacterized protein n=1 Tax=Cellulophaga geojensis KL-A TaxID=1328323 RepID=A0ABN0RLF6_9FLAO|nr:MULTISPECIES: DUF6882 domain-containing protein [Cellulophaga]APU11778.1 hypothetical protein A5M85_16270 [Cellulophaga lytica]EWH12656.1 hypothetical protein KLA_13614 [Cellulophaga geojensis KL-A]